MIGSMSVATLRSPERPPSALRPLRRETERSLAERIAPAAGSADVGVAEPEAPLEGLAAVLALEPQPRGHDRGIAPDPHRLGAGVLVLALVLDRPALGFLEQV